jgi:hypothetical protein
LLITEPIVIFRPQAVNYYFKAIEIAVICLLLRNIKVSFKNVKYEPFYTHASCGFVFTYQTIENDLIPVEIHPFELITYLSGLFTSCPQKNNDH